MSQVRAKRARRWRLFNRAIARLRASWAPKAVTFDMLEQRRMLSSTLDIGNVALIEPATGIGAMSFPVTLSDIATSDVTVKYKTISGSAKAGKDFVGTTGSLVIPAGTLTANLNITIIGGISGNTTKQFEVKILKATNATIGNNIATGSITDDITPNLNVESATTTEGKKHSLKLGVLLSGKSTTPVTVHWSTADGSALAGIDYAASQGDLTFRPGKTLKKISVPIIGKSSPANTETFNVNLSNPTNATVGTNGLETIVGTNGLNQVTINDATITRPKSGYKDLNFQVQLSQPSDGTVSVQYETVPVAGSVGQYVSVAGTVQFLNGQTTADITVPIVGTTFYNPQMTFDVVLANPVDAQIVDGIGVGTINSNSTPPQAPPPFVSVNSISADEGNSGDTPFTFNVTLSTPSAQPVVVYYQTQDGTAKDGTDYAGGSGAVYFPAGATVEPVTVQVLGNTTLEPNKTFDLDLTGATNALLSPTGIEGVATIVNDDFPALSVSDAIASATSVGTTTIAVFTISLSEPTDADVTADYSTSDGTATVADGDYDATSGVLDFAPGETSKTVSVTVNGQGTADIGDTFFLNLTHVSDTAILGTAQGTATIVQPPTISTSDITVDESGAGGRAAVFTVSLSNVSTQTVTVNYATADVTAHAGTDYTNETGTLTFQAGGALSQTVTIPVASNIEDGKTFTLNLSSGTNATILDGQGTALLTNPPTVSVSDPNIPSTTTATSTADFVVSLSAPSLRTITVHYTTEDGTATSPADYQAVSGTITFPGADEQEEADFIGGAITSDLTATGTSIDVPVTVFTSPSIEDGSQFFLDLSSPTIATLGTSEAAATFVNPPAISVADLNVPVDGASATADFALTLSAPSRRSITVHYTTADGTANSASDYSAANGTVTFPAGTTTEDVPVSVSSVALDGGTFFLDLSSPTNATLTTTEATATIENTPTISIADVSQNEGDSGTSNMQFVVTLSNPSVNEIMVNYYTQDGTASGGVDYTFESGGLDFAAGQTTADINVPIIGNSTYEPDKTFTVNLIDPSNATLNNATATGTILNDDALPTIQISPASAEEGNSGCTQMVFDVSLSNPSYQGISVDYFTSDDTANAGDDYQSTSGSLDFAPGQTTGTISVNVYGDTIAETDEDFFLNFDNAVNANLPTTQTTGTILNDDGGSISINNVVVPENDPNFNPTEAIFTITLATPYADDVNVQYNTVDDSASGGVDYVSTSGSVDFAPGETQKIVTVPVIDTFSASGSPDFFLDITSVSSGVPVDQGSGMATIIENDSLPGVSVSDSSVEESPDPASQQPMQFTVTVSGPHALPVTLDYNTFDETFTPFPASGGVDYTVTTGSLTFPATDDDSASQIISVPITGGLDPINPENFGLSLTNIQNANDDGDTAYGTIENDNVAPAIGFADGSTNVSRSENDPSNGGNMAFDVSLNHSYTQDVTVHYATQSATASGGYDYTSTSGTLTIPAGQTDGTIEVPILNNTVITGDRNFNVVLSSPTVATLNGSSIQAQGTIIDDDSIPQASVTNNGAVSEGDSGTTEDDFTINLTAAYNNPVTVDYATSNGTAFGGSDENPTADYQSTSGSVTFEPGQTSMTVPVFINGNTIEQPDRDFNFNISSSDVPVQDSGTVLGVIQDDDAPDVNVSDPSLIEPPSGQIQNAEFTISLNKPLSYPVSMDYFTSGGGDEYESTSGSLDFAPGQTSMTVDVPVSGGADLNGNDQFTLNVIIHDPLNGDQYTAGLATVYATNKPSRTDMSINNPILSPIDADNSTLSFDISNDGTQASGNYKIKFYAVGYDGSGGSDCYQIEAFDPTTNQILKTIDPIAPGGDQSYSIEPLMVDANGNPIPAGYYNIKMVLCAPDSGVLTCSTTSNELPYIHTQVVWTGSGGDDQWNDAANWNTGAVPGTGDDVLIPQSQSDPIYYEDIDTEINSLTSNSPLILASGSLMVDTTVLVNADFELQGGELDNATILPGNCAQGLVLTSDGGTLKNIIAQADIDATADGATADVIDSLELDGTFYIGDCNSSCNSSTIEFDTDDAACFRLTGDGTLDFGKSSSNEIDSSASMLSIGSNITIDGRNGTINNTNGGFVQNNGAIAVRNLTIDGDLVNNGQLYPGGICNLGTLTVNGDFTQTSNGATTIDIGRFGSGGSDQIEVSGAANLDGTLNYQLVGNYQPNDGTAFDIIDASSVNGAFANVVNVGSNPYYTFSASYFDTDVVLTAMYIGPVTYYVDASNTGASNPDGLSWSGAFDDLQQALALAHPGDTIDVAAGTYYPGSDESDSFDIPSGVDVEGGFEGLLGGDPNDQNPSRNISILSGDIGEPGYSGDNSYQVVNASNTDSSTRLYGFTIEYGNSYTYGGGLTGEHADLTIADCTFTENYAGDGGGAIYLFQSSPDIVSDEFSDNFAGYAGGAIFIDTGSNPQISDSSFTDNSTEILGGAIYSEGAFGQIARSTFQGNTSGAGGAIALTGSNVSISNSAFVQNVAYGYYGEILTGGRGGAIAIDQSQLTVTSSTFTANSARTIAPDDGGYYAGYGAAIAAQDSALTVTNSILWADGAAYAPEIYSSGDTTVTVTYTDIDDAGYGAEATNLDADPLFARNPGTDSPDDFGDLHLGFGSPALNAGNDSIGAGGSTDLSGNLRVDNGQIDLGAYETKIIYVDYGATSGNDDGSLWIDAFTDLQAGLGAASPDNIVEVAGGTYHPTLSENPNISFDLPINAGVYGGFAGSALPSSPDTRNVSMYPTILSGDLGDGVHSYHVVQTYVPDDGTILTSATRLDGFTITGGETGNGTGGGGLLITEGSPTIANCIFIDNSSEFAGGAIGISQASPTIIDCTFIDNTAPYGGAIAGTSGGGGFVEGCTFTDNSAVGQYGDGGAVYLDDAGLILQGCTFYANTASDEGGAILGVDFSVTVTNCVFVGNIATGNAINPGQPVVGYGGAIYDQDGLLTVTNSTFTDNVAKGVESNGTYFGGYGGAIAGSENASITVSNSILWNNSAYTAPEVYYDETSSATITYSDIDDSDLSAGTGDINADPTFARNPSAGPDGVWGTSDDDYGDLQLVLGSPGIDAGNNADIPSDVTTDILGNPRIINSADTSDNAAGIVDMGAYETFPVYVDSGIEAAGVSFGGIQPLVGSQGTSWANAYTDLNIALANSQSGQMIFVAGGLYSPGQSVNSTFTLVNGVGLFGGFDGNETVTPDHRDVASNPSVLTGDLTGTGAGEYAYHVVTATDVDSSTILDGFLIIDGITGTDEADQGGAGMLLTDANLSINDCTFSNDTGTFGGAIYATDSSPLITNSTFESDTAATRGGAIYFVDGSPSLVSDIFTNDSGTPGNASTGGAVLFDHSTNAIVINSTFSGDSADFGGAIAFYAGSAYFNGDTFCNDTISQGYGGGAIFGSGTDLTITGSSFKHDGADISSQNNGGAINFDDGELSIDNTTFTDNSAEYGGAIFTDGTALNINATSFNGNNASEGGAIETYLEADTVTNSTFVGNSAAVGGALYLPTANITIDNSTFTDNAATDPSGVGGAIFASSGGVDIDNSIFWNDSANTDPEISHLSAVVDVAYSDVDGGYAGTGNINTDPEFYTAPVIGAGDSWDGAGVDYGYLAPANGSPVIDLGNNANIPAGVNFDIVGNPRIGNNVVDMGAYEQLALYVDANVTGGADDGSSWANAFTSLTTALADAHAGNRIDVAGGTYYPDDSDPNVSFGLSSGIEMFGGYAGSADSDPFTRNLDLYTTTLSGDLNNAGGSGYSGHLMISEDGAPGTRLDGFTFADAVGNSYGGALVVANGYLAISNSTFIDNGNSFPLRGLAINIIDQSTVIITNSTFTHNYTSYGYGGAIEASDSTLTITGSTFDNNSAAYGGAIDAENTQLTITNSVFTDNTAELGGAVSMNNASTAQITNCLFVANTAVGYYGDFSGQGGAVASYDSTLTVTNTTFSGNTAVSSSGGDDETLYSYGGAIWTDNSIATVTNSIIWNNSADYGSAIYSTGGLTVTYTDIDDQSLATDTGDLDLDPQFVRNPGTNSASDLGDERLLADSPLIDAGNNIAIGGVSSDLDGNKRIINDTVDLGAYEFNNVAFVDSAANGDGSSWADAYNSLATALADTGPDTRIYVAGGTYTPTTSGDRGASFNIANNDAVFGGFAGAANPGDPGLRDTSLYPTILSGEINDSSTTYDNSIHVVNVSGDSSTTLLDGLQISSGYSANGVPFNQSYGTGVYDNGGSPTFNNCTISNNAAENGGAVYAFGGADPVFTDCTFTGNSAENGGGIYADDASLTVTDSHFTDNSRNAIFITDNATLVVDGSTFNGNSGTAIWQNTGAGLLTVDHSTFVRNTGGFGGAILVLGQANISNSIFEGNATTPSGEGGAINFGGTIASTVTNSLFVGNFSGDGGAIYDNHAAPVISNCTFTSNSSQYYGGAILDASTGSSLVITNSILWNNVAQDFAHVENELDFNNNPLVSDSDIEGGFSGGIDISDFDPQFVQNPDPGTDGIWGTSDDNYGNLHLQPLSPAIDAGNNADVPSDNTTDLDGNPRISGTVDLGAYEIPMIYVDMNVDGGNNDGTSWANAFTDLQSALAPGEAQPGDMIRVAGGTYYPGTSSGQTATFDIPDGVLLYGGFAGSADSSQPNTHDTTLYLTTLSGDTGSIVTIASEAAVTIDGFTISNGSANSENGGGMLVLAGADVTVNNCTFTNDTAGVEGGAVDIDDFANVTFNDSTFTSNTGGLGGAVHASNDTVAFHDCTFTDNQALAGGAVYGLSVDNTFTDCTFTDNVATHFGGAIFNQSAPLNLSGCIFTDNSTTASGGGAFGGAIYNSGGGITATGSTFVNNSSAGTGGAIADFNDDSSSFTDCIFNGNISGGEGGAIYASTVDNITNSTFTGNVSAKGGAIFFANSGQSFPSTIVNTTFTQNTSTASGSTGGAIYNDASITSPETIPSVVIANSILWNNFSYLSGSGYVTDDVSGGGTGTTITYSDTTDAISGTGNISSDPLLARTPSAGADGIWGTSDDDYGDLRLIIGSPAIDVGLNSDVDPSITTDLAGAPRIVDSTNTSDTADAVVDMGAYETDPIYVDHGASGGNDGTTWADAYESLTDALSHAQAGQMMFVSNKAYAVSGNDSTASFNLVDGVSMFGGFEGNSTGTPDDRSGPSVLDGAFDNGGGTIYAYHVVTASNINILTVLDGFEIVDGHAVGSGTQADGGGILVDHSNLIISNNQFYSNQADNDGGAIYFLDSTPVMIHCQANGNSAANGGVAAVEGSSGGFINGGSFAGDTASNQGGAIWLDNSTVSLDNDDFNGGNDASVSGGGVAAISSNVTITDSTFVGGGDDASNGGGIYASGSTVAVSNDTFTGNSGFDGGAIDAESNSTLTVTDSQFTSNQADSSSGTGGAIEADNSAVTIDNSTFTGNTAEGGGAVSIDNSNQVVFDSDVFNDNHASFIAGAIGFGGSTATINNSLFVLNSSPTAGAISEGESTVTVVNSTFTDNSGGGDGTLELIDSTANIENSIFYGDDGELVNYTDSTFNVSDSDIGGGFAGTDNKDVDPQFLRNPGTNSASDAGDEHLSASSPLLGAGDVTFVTTSTDLNGNPRIVNNSVDMGAYEQQVIYVDGNLHTGNNDGTSWANAFTSLTDAINADTEEEPIEVAGGTYLPSTVGDNTASFDIPSGVILRGGYAGSANASDPDQRDLSMYPTILSGDIGNGAATNSYHVVFTFDDNSTTTLDGFTIQDGAGGSGGGGGVYIEHGYLTVSNCNFVDNTANGGQGGAIFIYQASVLTVLSSTFTGNSADNGGAISLLNSNGFTIENTTFSNNTGLEGGALYLNSFGGSGGSILDSTFANNLAADGGAMYISGGASKITNCVFVSNTAQGYANLAGGIGGAIDAPNSVSLTIVNSTFASNYSQVQFVESTPQASYGGAIYASASSVTVTNSILWNDSASDGQEIDTVSASLTVNNTDIDDSVLAAGGTDNLDIDPMFVRNPGTNSASDDGDLSLQSNSPAIDQGDNNAIPIGVVTDLAGNGRISGGTVDMGAYEFQYPTLFVDYAATGTGDGSSWANAFTTLTAALAADTTAESIDIAGGTYYPTDTTDRTISFVIPDGVALNGGFAGLAEPTTPYDRTAGNFPTILSGNIGSGGTDLDNSYHVITLTDVGSATILNGLTIRDGNADGTSAQDEGGGLLLTSSSPTISACVFEGNSAGLEGGAIADVDGSSPTVVNCIFSVNTAGISGSVAGLGGAVYTADSSPTFVNCTFAGNVALDPVALTSFGGAMYTTGSGTSTISNCILWNDTADVDSEIDANATVNIDHSDIAGGSTINGNAGADPLFVSNPGAPGSGDYGDLHLQFESPAIAAGDPSEVPGGITTDLDGNPRILDGDVDMGAYEMPLSS